MTISVRTCILNFLFTSKNKPITRKESNTNLEFARAGIKHFSCKFICLVWSLPGQGLDAVNSQGTKLLGFDAKNSGMEGSYQGSFCLLGLRRNYTSHKKDFFGVRRKYNYPILACGAEAVICLEWPEMAQTPKISKNTQYTKVYTEHQENNVNSIHRMLFCFLLEQKCTMYVLELHSTFRKGAQN